MQDEVVEVDITLAATEEEITALLWHCETMLAHRCSIDAVDLHPILEQIVSQIRGRDI